MSNKFETHAIRNQMKRSQYLEHSTPLYLTSSFVFEDAEDMRASFAEEKKRNIYSRFSNPNTSEFVQKVVQMEEADDGVSFATGMGAVFATFAAFLNAGDHIVSVRALFGSTHTLFTKYLPKWEISTSYFPVDDISLVEELIQPNTKCIYVESPTNPGVDILDLEAIGKIAKKHKLKVIYDAAHAIGSKYKGKSVLECGDISATSLHATKLINTGEGGACISVDDKLHEKLKRIRFFGHNQAKDIVEDGFNGKMTEVHAALGIANMNYFDDVINDRKQKYMFYQKSLSHLDFVRFQKLNIGESNYSYFPVIFDREERLLDAEKKLNKENIFPRRYFYPSVNEFKKIVKYRECKVSESISRRILCLPLYYTLKMSQIKLIVEILSNK